MQAGLHDWISDRLEPLDRSPGADGPRTSDFDLDPENWSSPGKPLTPAAVLVGLIERDHGLNVLLTRRSDNMRSHTGQVAFPGGRQDPGEGPIQTALREAHEEVGLEPHFVKPVGFSTPYQTGTGFLVTPVVGFIRSGFTLTPNPGEVADIFETPSGVKRRFYATTHEAQYIWGATAGMLRALHGRLYGAESS
jgi:8-oxo-dGTP pyrophosphatase MutT (NUDIX family)